MKNEKSKVIIAWIILLISICLASILTYFKFFPASNTNIEERPVNESSSYAIHNALKEITTNFNEISKEKNYNEENDITLIATVNNYSIFISYITDVTTTYEFTYDNLCLNITINSTEEDKIKFNLIYEVLIEAVQKRINNTEEISDVVNDFLNTDKNYEGLIKTKVEDGIKYQMNITKKLN